MPLRRTLIAALALSCVFSGALVAAPAMATSERATDHGAMIVHKDPFCGCCTAWAEHMEAAGFRVEIRETSLMDEVKARLGVPRDLASCHTAEIDGYVIEGHVPAAAVEALLSQRPDVVGLSVPGMPIGSPGMEVPGVAPERYDVVAFGERGAQVVGRFVGAERVER